jgi:hypothetical protein
VRLPIHSTQQRHMRHDSLPITGLAIYLWTIGSIDCLALLTDQLMHLIFSNLGDNLWNLDHLSPKRAGVLSTQPMTTLPANLWIVLDDFFAHLGV